MKRIFAMLLSLLMTAALLTACGGQAGLQDGYYTAQMSQFSHGWKEYITILVKGGSIVSVEYNAENASGFIKSWDNAYMQNMLHSNGTYPNEYTRTYAGQLLEGQGQGSIDAISGATSSHGTFQLLAQAVLDQARKGDSSIVFVDTNTICGCPSRFQIGGGFPRQFSFEAAAIIKKSRKQTAVRFRLFYFNQDSSNSTPTG